MEGVLVSAQRDASTITITGVSDTHGRYAFPENRLEPGPLQAADPCDRIRSGQRRAGAN